MLALRPSGSRDDDHLTRGCRIVQAMPDQCRLRPSSPSGWDGGGSGQIGDVIVNGQCSGRCGRAIDETQVATHAIDFVFQTQQLPLIWISEAVPCAEHSIECLDRFTRSQFADRDTSSGSRLESFSDRVKRTAVALGGKAQIKQRRSDLRGQLRSPQRNLWRYSTVVVLLEYARKVRQVIFA